MQKANCVSVETSFANFHASKVYCSYIYVSEEVSTFKRKSEYDDWLEKTLCLAIH